MNTFNYGIRFCRLQPASTYCTHEVLPHLADYHIGCFTEVIIKGGGFQRRLKCIQVQSVIIALTVAITEFGNITFKKKLPEPCSQLSLAIIIPVLGVIIKNFNIWPMTKHKTKDIIYSK